MLLRRGVILGALVCVAINIADIASSYNADVITDKLEKSQVAYNQITSKIGKSIITLASLSNNYKLNSKSDVFFKKKKKFYSKRILYRIIMREFPLPVFPYRFKGQVIAKVTAYEPSKRSCGKFADGKTSIMKNAYDLTGIAADPTVLPYGTVVYIPEVGYKTVDDTGIAMKKSWRQKKELHIDLRFLTVKAAVEWGVKYKKIEIYEKID